MREREGIVEREKGKEGSREIDRGGRPSLNTSFLLSLEAVTELI